MAKEMNKKAILRIRNFGLFVLFICVLFLMVIFSSNSFAQESYEVGDVIKIPLKSNEDILVKVNSPEGSYLYLMSGEYFSLNLNSAGDYSVAVKNGEETKEYFFNVVGKIETVNKVVIDQKKSYVQMLLEELSLMRSEYNSLSETVVIEDINYLNVSELIKVGEDVSQSKKVTVNSKQTMKLKIPKSASGIKVVDSNGKEFSYNVQSGLVEVVSGFFSEKKEKSLIIKDAVGELDISYFTKAPQKEEKNISKFKKEVKVRSDEGLHYENVLVSSQINEIIPMGRRNYLKIYWKEADTYLDFIPKDNNGNGLIDEVEWVVPHLSEQTFEIIVISHAQHLTSQRLFLEDIFDSVYELDNIWKFIPSGDFVRVTFEKNLTNENDITVYARPYTTSSINVYEKDSNKVLVAFPEFSDEGMYKVYLNELVGEQDTFDLEFIGGTYVDYIVDPTAIGQCVGIVSCLDQGVAITCTCSEVDSSNDVYAGSVLRTKSANVAEVIINMTNSSLIESGSLISDADLYVEMYVQSGMSACTIDYRIGSGSWNSLDSDCTDENSETTLSFDMSSLTETQLEDLDVRVSAVKNSGKGAPLNMYVDYVYLNITYATVGGDLFVNLTSPDDAFETSFTNNYFNYTPTSSSGDYLNCSFWDNSTGSFLQNKTNSSVITNNSNNYFTQTFSSDGHFVWNIKCCDATNGCVFAPLNRTIIIDTTAPTVISLNPENDSISSSLYGVDFVYNVSDTRNIENCSLILDGESVLSDTSINKNVNQTLSYPVPAGVHIWAISCIDGSGNSDISENRTIDVSFSPQTYDKRWYETSTLDFTSTADIFLSNTRDGTENEILYTLGPQTVYTLTESISPFMVNNGALVGSGNVDFSGYFTTSQSNQIYITWKVYVTNSSGDTLICQSGDDSASGTVLGSASGTFTDSCSNPSDIYLSPTDRIRLIVNAWNNHGNNIINIGHYWDNLYLSFVEFNTFSSLGNLIVDLISPNTDLNVNTNEDFNMTCFVNCTAGDCLDTNVYVQYNTSATDWTNIGASGNLVLDGGETNPHNIGTVNTSSAQTNFTITGNIESVNNIRCIAESDYSSANGTTIKQVIVTGTNSPPNVFLDNPGNTSWEDSQTVDFFYNVSDFDDNLETCSLYLDGVFNISNQTILQNNQLNNFTVSGLSQGTHNWYVNCSDDLGENNFSDTWEFYVDSIFPTFDLHAPLEGIDLIYGDVTFNFTVTDNLDDSLTCDLIVDGIVKNNDFSAGNDSYTTVTISDLSSGVHYWNVTCWDNAGNINNSETRNFTLTDSPPNVILTNPEDDWWFNVSSVNLFYNVTDDINLKSCSLYLNGVFNQSNSTPVLNAEINNFSLSLGEGTYNWTVNCTDTGDQTDTDTFRDFYVDLSKPIINLHYPFVDDILGTTSVTFNFTVTDNLDNPLTCDLIVDGVVKNNDFSANNGSYVTSEVFGLLLTDHYWNVTCWDDAGNINTSETRNFTISDVPPVVNLTSPYDEEWFNYSNINFFYNVTDEVGIESCSLYLNGIFNQSNSTPVLISEINNFSLSLGEGTYNWTVSCNDTGGYTDLDTVRDFYVDWTEPVLIVNEPQNNTIVVVNNVTFNLTILDNVGTEFICNISDTQGFNYFEEEIFSVGENLRYYLFNDGTYLWDFSCRDYAGNGNYTGTYNFSVVAPPNVILNFPEPDYWTKDSSIIFNYTPEDDVGLTKCDLYLDGVFNDTDIDIERNEPNFFSVPGINEGEHNWTVECTDPDSNVYAPTAIKFYRDNSPPVIELLSPENDSGIDYNENRIFFRWNATDTLDSTLSCDLFIDEEVKVPDIVVSSGFIRSQDVDTIDIGQGYHNWTLNCTDQVGNWNVSETWFFNLTYPDFEVSDLDIEFNVSTPKEDEEILISANISNLGGANVSDVSVRFYDGNPISGGVIIGSEILIDIDKFNYTTVSVEWVSEIGDHEIYVIVDITNSFNETNETNNNASKYISVGSWQTFYGSINSDSKFALEKNSGAKVITWNITSFESGNLYLTDLEASIQWSELEAIGRKTDKTVSSNDFSEIDSSLGMDSYNASVYNTFTNSGVINDVKTLTIFDNSLENVPIVNSTDNSNFITGVLWDKSDDVSEDNEFDSSDACVRRRPWD